ncbi:MAG TPA: hypothetical protein VMJ13_11690 [Candidatus Acidoferrum sp.]|nr:hypothetical protein [Candidatus Acidoferrum sp.]
MIQRKFTRAQRVNFVSAAILFLMAAPLWAQSGKPAPFKDFQTYVAWMQKNHKAPFSRSGAMMPQGGVKALLEAQAKMHAAEAQNATPMSRSYQNVKVNQDRNPWPKVDITSAVDPSDPAGWLVMTIDYRVNFPRMFYHVSTNHGKNWTDDMLVEGSDPNIGSSPLSFQLDPGLSFDDAGNSYFSALSGNVIVDFNNNYLNIDSEVDVVQGFSDGAYSALIPTNIDVQPCSGMVFGPFVCDATVSQPRNSTDANSNSPNAGTNYVYYTYFCNLSPGPCTDGTATVPASASVILESHSTAPGEPYSAPALVSGALTSTQFADMVIDPSGTPHIFFDDFTNAPVITMWESTLTGGVWTVSKNPVASFVYNGLANANWGFADSGAAAPGCGIHGNTAYCAFSANQIAGGNLESTPSVYLAAVNVNTGASSIARVNHDAFNGMKDHFFAWATTAPGGAVYVGWYDDRNDPANTNVEYFVGKSFDGGRTFPIQKAVNDVPFNPCNGFPGCSYFGDYTQLASGPGGQVHAAWADTRDGVSMQIWSQTVLF